MPPLIVTALLEAAAQERFDGLRRSHFPPERNHLDAHLTLFHRLPDDPAIGAALEAAADRPVIRARVHRVKGWRGGVAYDLIAPELADLRARLARGWVSLLSAQDRAKADLHVTVQNKADPRPPRGCTPNWPPRSARTTCRSSAWACGATSADRGKRSADSASPCER